MYVVTWSIGRLAVVNDQGRVVFGEAEPIRDVLQKSHTRWARGDAIEVLKPGDKGHIEVALRSLPFAIVTGP